MTTVGLRPGVKNILIGIQECDLTDRECDKNTHDAYQQSRDAQQPEYDDKAEHFPPVFGDDLAAQFHRFPEAHSLVDDQGDGEYPGHRQIDSRHYAEA